MVIPALIDRVVRRNRRGTAAIETAFLLLPFIMVLVGVFEAGSYIGQQAILQDAVKTASRLISTGQINASGKPRFLSTISQNTYGLIDASKLSVNVTAYSSFNAVPDHFAPLFDSSGTATNQNFQTGSGNQVVVVQVGNWYPFALPSLFSAMSSGASIVTSNLVFRNEPF
ncbi:MAG: TadE/TadG family type IV pilus assembly protein [Rhodospirillaceae bacterium]